MNDLQQDEQQLLEGYRQGKKWREEFEALEKEDPYVDRGDIATYMNTTGISSPREAYNKINDIDSSETPKEPERTPITDFYELREKAHEYLEQRREENKNIPSTEVTGITDPEELKNNMREFLDKRSEERG